MLLVCHMPSFVAGLTAATGTGDVSRKTGFEAGDSSSQAVRIVCLRKIGGVLPPGYSERKDAKSSSALRSPGEAVNQDRM